MPTDPEKFGEGLKKIESAISAQEGLRGILPDEQIEMSLSALMERRDSIKAGLEGTGAIAQGEKAWAVGERGMMARDVQGLMLSGDGNIVIVATDHLFAAIFSEADFREGPATGH